MKSYTISVELTSQKEKAMTHRVITYFVSPGTEKRFVSIKYLWIKSKSFLLNTEDSFKSPFTRVFKIKAESSRKFKSGDVKIVK